MKRDNETWTAGYLGFEGTAEKTAEALGRILEAQSWADEKQPQPSERLVRHYTTKGALDPPERQGKEAIYGFRQIVQYLALRWLLQDGWPLEKAALTTSARSTEELLALLPSEETAAERMARRLELKAAMHQARPTPSAPAKPGAGASGSVLESQTRYSARTGRLANALAELGAPNRAAEAREVVEVSVTPWCRVSIEADGLARLTERDLEALGRALEAALVDARLELMRRGRRK